jgi:hypothetical protein
MASPLVPDLLEPMTGFARSASADSKAGFNKGQLAGISVQKAPNLSRKLSHRPRINEK